MQYNVGTALVSIAAIAVAGCGMDSSPDEPEEPTQSGIALTVDVGQMSDVEALHFDITTCEGDDVVEESVALSELSFDEKMELDTPGATTFADYFATLEAGCYDVEIVPIDAEGSPVEQCTVATAQDVEVAAGKTTEIAMVSQCGGTQAGGLDTLGVINFAPRITTLEFDPSKIVGCESVTVCASAVDSDGDAIEFEWNQLQGPEPLEGPEVVSSTEDDGVFTECVEMTPGFTARYRFEVVAYDLMEDDEGTLVRVEDLIEVVDETQISHSALSFPVYAECEDPDEDVLDEIEERDDKKEKKDEDVREEIEDKPPNDVLGEVEDDEDKEDEKKKKDEPEDVLEEIEARDDKKDEKKEEKERTDEEDEKKKDDPPEDVLGDVEEDKEEKNDEAPEDVLGEVEDDKKEKKEAPEQGLAVMENCTHRLHVWRLFHDHADDSKFDRPWPIEEATMLGKYTWFEIVTGEVKDKGTWFKLAQQYVVARLNIADGAEAPKVVEKSLDEAEMLLESGTIARHDRVRAADLKHLLWAFNAGEIGPGMCPDPLVK